MIRLLMGITLSEAGGSQRVVFSIISNLPEDIYDITLVTSPGGELLDWIEELNGDRKNKVRIIALDSLRRNISPLYDLIAFFRLIRLMKRNKYDIAHFHNSKMGILGRLAAKISRLPKVYYTVHGWGLNKETTGFLYPVLSSVEKIVMRFTTKVIFVSQKDLEAGIRNGWAYSSDSCLIYNGISDHSVAGEQPQSSLKISRDLPVIIFVARLSEPKDPLFAIKVSERLLRDGCNHMLMIIGNGPKLEACIESVKLLGIEQNVLLLGKQDNVTELLMEADIFCLYSKWEGLPVSILEAMYCGLPVVASGVGGVPELVEHGKTGYLLDGFDTGKAAGYLKELIQDRNKRAGMGKEARAAAYKKFNLTNMMNQYRQLYEE